jgi:anti-sigma-K factor RskA
MPEAPTRPDPLALQATALRYAAGELPPGDSAEFEARLADDQDTRDALAEAVRLSAAALGQEPPSPDRTFRSMIRERLRPVSAWWARWLARRAYRGHPLTWAGIGAGTVAAATVLGLHLADAGRAASTAAAPRPPEPPTIPRLEVAPAPRPVVHADDTALKEAEIWAELSTPEHVERAHDEELRRRQRMQNWHAPHGHPNHPPPAAEHR